MTIRSVQSGVAKVVGNSYGGGVHGEVEGRSILADGLGLPDLALAQRGIGAGPDGRTVQKGVDPGTGAGRVI